MSANRLRDKVFIITGGAHGIGAATVQRCSEEGARVVLVDIDRARGEAAAAKYGATYSATDVSDHAAVGALVTQTVHEFGQLDCVVSNACLHRYAASKGGQLALMQQLAADLAPAIRVNAILPGTIRSYPESLDAEQEAYWSGIHALKRIGECVEVANGVVFLASDEASFITGHSLAIDGGVAIYAGR